jgi:hypothetical protein
MTHPEARLHVEMFPASHGDAFLVRCVAPDRTTNVLVDGGLAATYQEHLRQRLLELNQSGQDLSAFIITHIDSDHIEGAIEFLSENGPADSPKIIPIRDVWHNSYRHLPLSGRSPSIDEKARVLSQITLPTQRGEGDISARQGSTLAALLRKYGYSWNGAFEGNAVVVPQAALPRLSLGHGVDLTLLSPTEKRLKALIRKWRQELLLLGAANDAVDSPEFETAFEITLLKDIDDYGDVATTISSTDLREAPDPATFREDRSVTNGSSIAFLLQFAGRSALFLGDAFPSVISEQLQRLPVASLPISLDLVKVSHHGSKRNTSPELLSKITAKHFLISTDGSKHKHPDMEALLWIASSQHGGTSLDFNYQTPESLAIDHPDIRGKYHHAVHVANPRTSFNLIL